MERNDNLYSNCAPRIGHGITQAYSRPRWVWTRLPLLLVVFTVILLSLPVYADDDDTEASPPGPRPLVTEITVTGRPTDPVEIPVLVRAVDSEEVSKIFGSGTLVGTVSGPDKGGLVYVSDSDCLPTEDAYFESPSDPNVKIVCLRIQGLDAPGEYKGSVDVTNNNYDEDAVSLTVTISSRAPPEAKPIPESITVSGTQFDRIEVPFWKLADGVWPTFFEPDGEDPISFVIGPNQRIGKVYIDSTDCGQSSDPDIRVVCLRVENVDAPGSYKGNVDVTDNNSGEDALPLTVTKVAALATDINITGPPFEDIAVPFLKAKDGTWPKFFEYDPKNPVAFISGPNQAVGKVYIVECKLQASEAKNENIEYVCLQVRELDTPGTYEGTIDVTDNNDDKDALKLNVTVKDAARLTTDITVTAPPFEDIAVPFVKAKDGACPEFFKSEDPIGYLIGPDQSVASIFITNIPCEESPDSDVVTVLLKVEGLSTPGEYVGKADVTDNDNETDAFTLKVKVKALPLVSTITASGKRMWKWPAVITGLGNIEVPFHVSDQTHNPDFFKEGELVGGVGGSDQVGEVRRVACKDTSATNNNIKTACLKITGLNRPGKFTGKVDVTDNNDDSDALNLSVTVTDWVVWAILASLLSLFLSYIFLAWRPKKWNPYWTLHDKAKGLQAGITEVNGACHTPIHKGQQSVKVYARGFEWPAKQILIYWDEVHGTELAKVEPPNDGSTRFDWECSFDILGQMLSEDTHDIIATTFDSAIEKKTAFTIPCPSQKGNDTREIQKKLKRWRKASEPCEISDSSGTTAKFQITTNPKLRWYRLKADTHFESFWKALADYYRSQLVWDTSSEEYKGLESLLEQADGDLKRFRNFGSELDKLNDQLNKFKAFLACNPIGIAPPALVKTIENQLKGTDIPISKVSRVQARLDTWVELRTLMKQWQRMAMDITRYDKWIDELKKKVENSSNNDKKAQDLEILRRARSKLQEAKYEMFDAVDAKHLEELRTKKELDIIYRQLAYLGGKYDYWEDPPSPKECLKDILQKWRELTKPLASILESIAQVQAGLGIELPDVGAKISSISDLVNQYEFGKALDQIERILPDLEPVPEALVGLPALLTKVISILVNQYGPVEGLKHIERILPDLELEPTFGLGDLSASFESFRFQLRSHGFSLKAICDVEGEAVPEAEEAPQKVLIRARWWLDALAFLFALGVAVLTILRSQYLDRTFGTWADYLTLILISGAAPLASTGLVDIISRFFKRQ
jgi:hypothetical protein